MLNREDLVVRLTTGEDWLIQRVLGYAREFGYAKYTSTLEEAWRMSIRGLTQSLTGAIERWEAPLELGPDEDFASEPVSAFGVLEARRHRERGISFTMFLGLMKYYRRAYTDICSQWGWCEDDRRAAEAYVDLFFNRVELAFCSEWLKSPEAEKLLELQDATRRMTNEKNRYLTIFESLGTPAVLFDQSAHPLNSNQAAVRLFENSASPGAGYYQQEPVTFGLPWLQQEAEVFTRLGASEAILEREIATPDGLKTFEIRLKAMLDVSGKFEGTTAILFDLTKLRHLERERERVIADLTTALAEVRTLSGLLPICAWCKKVRDDRGYWSQIEAYVTKHTNAEFTHGLCPECSERVNLEMEEEER